ncbi:MAG: polysaccharide deacetylase family protein [Chloroflexi bacterium]|nr:polysaccharide deacetylase family protein [Chloroflexota bacterium]
MTHTIELLHHLWQQASHVIAPMRLLLALTIVSSMSGSIVVQARWETPETRRAPRRVSTPSPTPTAVVLPDEAQVPILMYHYVSELPPDADSYRVDLTVKPEDFRAQLQYLAAAGFDTITLDDLYLHLTKGHPLPNKPVILTFDDGYRDAYEVVYPMLVEYGFTATFFILATPAHFESPQYLTWAQMKEMADAGMAIQSHGRDHVDLRGRSYEYLVYQTVGVKEAIEYHTGQPARFFCYPSGRYDDDLIAVLKSAGYLGAVTTEWGTTASRAGLFELPRLRIRGNTSLAAFASMLKH